jgi:hypothetical protein
LEARTDIEEAYKRSFRKFLRGIKNEKGNKNIFCSTVYPVVLNWIIPKTWIGNTTRSIRVHNEILNKLEKARRRRNV